MMKEDKDTLLGEKKYYIDLAPKKRQSIAPCVNPGEGIIIKSFVPDHGSVRRV